MKPSRLAQSAADSAQSRSSRNSAIATSEVIGPWPCCTASAWAMAMRCWRGAARTVRTVAWKAASAAIWSFMLVAAVSSTLNG